LDEPTNHLDLDSKEVLENALIDYPGTILFVSHDRYFINRIATKILELSSEGSTEYLGDYDYYVEKKTEMEELEQLKKLTSKTVVPQESQDKTSYQQDKEVKKQERQKKRKLEELELKIEELEELIGSYEQQLCDPDIFQDHEKVLEITQKNDKAKSDLEQLMDEWAALAE
jgi:ATP-binding cassette, subfamily F, member 3